MNTLQLKASLTLQSDKSKVTGPYLSLTLTLTHKVKVSLLRLVIVALALSVFSRFVTGLGLVKSFKVSEHFKVSECDP